MKRSQAHHLSIAERDQMVRLIRDGMSVADIAQRLHCSERVVYTWRKRVRSGGEAFCAGAPEVQGPAIKRLCIRAECLEEALTGNLCAKHRKSAPAQTIPLARLMAGRA